MKMNGDPMAPRRWAPFPRRFHLIEDSEGRKRVLEELPSRVVVHRTDESVTEAITHYCHSALMTVPGADVSYNQAEACKKLWWSITPSLAETPLSMAEGSDGRLTFNRLPFDATVDRDAVLRGEFPAAECPRFEEFLTRCSQPLAVAAFIGSIFYPEADRQQYLYLYGEGQDGKGALMRMLHKLLKGAAQAVEPRERADRFWNAKIFGKRLLLFTDCATPEYFVSPGFKALTGDDPLYFEEKGKMGFTAIPTCKVMVASNLKPAITSQRSDMRRLIYAEVKPIGGGLVPRYEDLLLAEAGAIAAACKSHYVSLCPDFGPIPCDPPTAIADEAEEGFTEAFHAFFQVASAEKFVSGCEVRQLLTKIGIKNDRVISRLKATWEREFKVAVRKVNGGVIRYFGMTRKIHPVESIGDYGSGYGGQYDQ